MIAEQHVNKEIKAQKQVVARLKREVFGVDKTYKSKYIRDFNSEFSSYHRSCTFPDIIRRARASDIVYFGDYHPLRASQDWVLYLIKELHRGGSRVILALEMLYEYQQEYLELWMNGKMGEDEFLNKVDYRSEWGFSWPSYRRIFKLAKDPFVPIFGIDSDPRDQLELIRSRDKMIARRIATIRGFFPHHVILTVIGESHLASNHLPREVRKLCGSDLKEMVLVQNIDELYWKLMLRGAENTEAVQVDKNRYCIFTSSPIIKYQSYRDIIEEWREGGDSDPLASSMQEMMDNVLLFLFGKRSTLKVTVNGDWREPVGSVLPEIEYHKTYSSFLSYLRSRKVSRLGLMAVQERLKRNKMYYLPALNLFLVTELDLRRAAREISRFVVYAIRDEVGIRNRKERSLDNRFYASVFEEALSILGAKIINPTLNPVAENPLLGCIDPRGVVRYPLPGLSMRETRHICARLKYHFRRERKSRDGLRITHKLLRIFKMNIKKRLYLINVLGSTLGEAIYLRYHEGRVSREEILSLFRETFQEPGVGKHLYIQWVRKTSPYRARWGGRNES